MLSTQTTTPGSETALETIAAREAVQEQHVQEVQVELQKNEVELKDRIADDKKRQSAAMREKAKEELRAYVDGDIAASIRTDEETIQRDVHALDALYEKQKGTVVSELLEQASTGTFLTSH